MSKSEFLNRLRAAVTADRSTGGGAKFWGNQEHRETYGEAARKFFDLQHELTAHDCADVLEALEMEPKAELEETEYAAFKWAQIKPYLKELTAAVIRPFAPALATYDLTAIKGLLKDYFDNAQLIGSGQPSISSLVDYLDRLGMINAGWRDMNTAPKDESIIGLISDGDHYIEAQLVFIDGEWWDTNEQAVEPIRWRPCLNVRR